MMLASARKGLSNPFMILAIAVCGVFMGWSIRESKGALKMVPMISDMMKQMRDATPEVSKNPTQNSEEVRQHVEDQVKTSKVRMKSQGSSRRRGTSSSALASLAQMGQRMADGPSTMDSAVDLPTAVVLQVEVKADYVDEFIKVITGDEVGTLSEPGCLRFDLLRDKENPNKFTTYEVFKNDAAMDAHKAKRYVKAWGAFQYGEKHPIVKKTLMKTDAIHFHVSKRHPQDKVPIALVLELEIKEECVEEFLQVMAAYVDGSLAEAGCLRLDLLRDKENPLKFILYEVFQSYEAMNSHTAMPYVKAWDAFQYGEKAPVASKSLSENDAIIF